MSERRSASTILLLVGSNPLPNYLAATELMADRAILFYSGDTHDPKERLKSALRKVGVRVDDGTAGERLIADPTEAASVTIAFHSFPAGSHLHYTGGTKTMAVHASLAFYRNGGEVQQASYLDEHRAALRFDDGVDQSLSCAPLTLELLGDLHGFKPQPTQVQEGKSLPGTTAAAHAFLSGTAQSDRGEWLEHWVGDLLAHHTFKQVPTGVHCHPTSGGKRRQFEVDCVLVRDYRTFFVSCTTSKNLGTCKAKLFEIAVRARQMGGDLARSALVCGLTGTDQDGELWIDKLRQDIASVWGAQNTPAVFGRDDLEDWIGLHGKRHLVALELWLSS